MKGGPSWREMEDEMRGLGFWETMKLREHARLDKTASSSIDFVMLFIYVRAFVCQCVLL